MISNEQFELRQNEIEMKIEKMAEREGLITSDVGPIYDGVGDACAFLSSHPRIAWVLKEPYDVVKDEKIEGGGWSIPRACFMNDAQDWSNRTWQRVIYVMYGLRHNLHYADMDYIRDNWEMGKVLREIAWINLNKMPARKTSSNAAVKMAYDKYWKKIVKEQIDLYNPDVIVFGNTLDICRDAFLEEMDSPIEYVDREDVCFISVFKKDGRLLVHAYHPGFRYVKGVKGGEQHYVDSLIDTIQKCYK